MKKILIFMTILVAASSVLFSQDRAVARGAEPGELYLTTFWYGIYHGGTPYYDTLRTAVFRIANHGEHLTVQYDVDYFADNYTEPGSVMQPRYILADATPGVLYTKRVYEKNYYDYTQLWVSFDYGKSWVFREENIGVKKYFSANFDGLIYRAGTDGSYKSLNYAESFVLIKAQQINTNETGLEECEFFTLNGNAFYHTLDCYQNYINLTIGSEYASSGQTGFFPDVYRGGVEGEVYIHSWFPWYKYRASFSADTGYTFRHVYVDDDYQWKNSVFSQNQLLFMSDREPGVFYILHLNEVADSNPWGWHLELCIEYYRDYGETWVATYCHDVNKHYENEVCEPVNDLAAEIINSNAVLLTWTKPEEDLEIEGYRIYRDNKLLTNALITTTSYLDEELPNGDYEYYLTAHYANGCISDSSNHVAVTIEKEETCEPVNDLAAEIIDNNSILLTWSEPESNLTVEGYNIFRNNALLTEESATVNSYLDENLPNGEYEYYVITHYTDGCVSDSSNHVKETVGVGIETITNNEIRITVYPNPTDGELKMENGELKIENIEIFDLLGRTINNFQFSTFNFQLIDILHLPSGMYFVRITTENGMVTRKVVKR